MSLTRVLGIMISFLAVQPAMAQLFTDQGMMTGSGLAFFPTATTAPAAEMQLQYSRISFLSTSAERANLMGLTVGFSSALEGYFHVTSEELQTSTAQLSYGFGGKFRLPVTVPVLRRVALWMESTFSDMNDQRVKTIFPTQANRGGISASLDSNGFHPSLFFGGNQLNKVVTPMAGAGFTLALGHGGQLGVEGLWGYLEKGSMQASMTGSMRIFSNISAHITPGYLKTATLNGWMLSAGVSFTTADIDFHQARPNEDETGKFTLPSIDELEKGSEQEKNK